VPRSSMSRLRALSRRPERLAGLGLAVAVYLGCFELLHHLFYAHAVITDTPLYETYGEAMRHGKVPYRDFALEYPPGALPMFIAPTWITHDYADNFWWLMASLGACCLVLAALCRPPRVAIPFLALSPLLVGSYLPTRFDLWPTLLVMLSLTMLVRDHHRLGWGALAAAFTAKLFPFVLMPIAAAWTLRRRGQGEFWVCVAIAAAVIDAVFGPFAVVAPHGLYESVVGELSRPLQIESLAAAVLMTLGHPHEIVTHGSFNLSGEGALAALSSFVAAVALAAVWFSFARGPAEPARFLRLSAACVCAFVAFGKVLSPQFLIWLVPTVPLARGRRGLAATGLLAAALIDTEIWFPGRYFPYVYHSHLAWLVLVRDLLLVALFLVLSLPRPGSPRSWSPVRRARTRRAPPRSAPLPPRPRAGPETP
jgi:hypothetical protein